MENAIKWFWEHEFGNSEVGYDFAGYEVRKGSYGQEGSQYGWNVDHILPKSMGGTDDVSNRQITHIGTNSERGNKMTFWIDDTSYQVKRVSRLYDDDEITDYPYIDNEKKYCIVVLEEAGEKEYASDNSYEYDD